MLDNRFGMLRENPRKRFSRRLASDRNAASEVRAWRGFRRCPRATDDPGPGARCELRRPGIKGRRIGAGQGLRRKAAWMFPETGDCGCARLAGPVLRSPRL